MSLREWLKQAAEVRDIKVEQGVAKQQGSSLYQIRLTPQQERDLQAALDRQVKRTWRDA